MLCRYVRACGHTRACGNLGANEVRSLMDLCVRSACVQGYFEPVTRVRSHLKFFDVFKHFPKYYQKKIWLEARNLLIAEFRNNLDLNVRQETEEEIIESDDEDSFLPKKKPRTNENPIKIVDDYLRSDCQELSLLKAMPILEKLFRKYNTSLPSSAPVERMFSSAGGIFTKRRHQLSDEHFEMQLLLRINQKFWKN